MTAEPQIGRYLGRPTTMGMRAVRVYILYSIYFWAVLSYVGPAHMQRHLGFTHASDMYAQHAQRRTSWCMHGLEHVCPAETTSSLSADVEHW